MFFPRHWPARTLTQLFELRKERDAQLAEKRRVFGQRALARVKARYDVDPGKPAVWNLLVISAAAIGAPSEPASSKAGHMWRGHSPTGKL